MNYRWNIAEAEVDRARQLAQAAGISPLLAQCLLNRGQTSPEAVQRFLQPRLKSLADPFLLPDMMAAVERLLQARERKESVVIFGDYDVDGVSSTALLVESLGQLGWRVNAFLPRRLEEGYGLSQDGVENCLRRFAANLLVAVDCGSTAAESVAWLNGQGVDVVVVDHHQVSDPAPAVRALVNPRQAATDAPSFRELCSAGLCFKLLHALVKQGRELKLAGFAEFDLKPFLDLVALATVADLVPLTGENRLLVHAGLQRLSQTTRPGLQALKKVAGAGEEVDTFTVGYQLGPRLNAAGRLENAEASLHLLLAKTLAEAEPLALDLDTQNRERQQIEKNIAKEVLGAVRARFNPAEDFVIVEGQLLWHIGVVGIVASRVLREFYRPTIILGGDNEQWRGSGRSIEGFDMAAALRACDDLLVRHGGHAMAAGVSLNPDRVDDFRRRLNAMARSQLQPEQLQPKLPLDAAVSLADLSAERLAELALMEPTGQGNPPLQFAIRGLTQSRPVLWIGREKQHAKGWVTQNGMTAEWVWWNADKNRIPTGRFDLACTAEINEFNGRRSVQLRLLDWRPA